MPTDNSKTDEEIQKLKENKKESEVYMDAIRGSLFGGAVGDALGYPVEFQSETSIFQTNGSKGIEKYELSSRTGKAFISDDTQMTLFTATGLLYGDTRGALRGLMAAPHEYVRQAYQNWLLTQEKTYVEAEKDRKDWPVSWLLDIPELYRRRAPGTTCLSALRMQRNSKTHIDDYIEFSQNNSKGCGGIMRVAPIALDYSYRFQSMKKLDWEGAEIAAITHGHSLGYMPAAVVTHIIHRIVYGGDDGQKMDLFAIVSEAKETVDDLFHGDRNLQKMDDVIDLAVQLSKNGGDDPDNIHRIGEGWVAEETLGIALYCSLKYQDDFSSGVIAAVNHNGDSDSTGAVTGNILGALVGYDKIEEKWKQNLELSDVILEIADDLCHGCPMSEYGHYRDPNWLSKYVYGHRYAE